MSVRGDICIYIYITIVVTKNSHGLDELAWHLGVTQVTQGSLEAWLPFQVGLRGLPAQLPHGLHCAQTPTEQVPAKSPLMAKLC